MHQKTTFAVVEGWLCVRYETTDYGKPELVTHYWPCYQISSVAELEQAYPGIIGGEAVKNSTESYHYRIAPFQYQDFRLKDGGRTMPIKTTIEPVPPPKTKVQTRWYSGQWQKYLKTQGWVTV